MKKLIILLVIAIALVGCGRESEQIDADSTQVEEKVQSLTIAWHKVSGDDGGICELSTATQLTVDQASQELRRMLADEGIEIAVRTLTPEKVEGGECLCNRVLIQGRFVDEWLGAKLVKTACSGCPNQKACAKSAGSGSSCGGQYAMIHGGKTYTVLPADIIVAAGMIAAADLTGEPIAYGGCPGAGACKGECTCGKCAGGCVNQAAAACTPECPGMATGCPATCKGGQAVTAGAAEKTVAAGAKTSGCPQAGAGCKGKSCPASSGR